MRGSPSFTPQDTPFPTPSSTPVPTSSLSPAPQDERVVRMKYVTRRLQAFVQSDQCQDMLTQSNPDIIRWRLNWTVRRATFHAIELNEMARERYGDGRQLLVTPVTRGLQISVDTSAEASSDTSSAETSADKPSKPQYSKRVIRRKGKLRERRDLQREYAEHLEDYYCGSSR